jgi:hypothetical protein
VIFRKRKEQKAVSFCSTPKTGLVAVTGSFWGRAKAESFSHFSLPKNPTIRLLDV